ncbi:hypothetical protein A2715_00925 [Candidatus Woesebacteria bacterium RIFCSPHIGHO2_01_FULL_39_32]|uniref:Polymerase I protein n=2 Tax=Candidatus Woeseibacteriota TaxID=1752722 RepID=A0A0G0PQC3_9BACT|nr:MAG: polymerase I protein [Candidatus Woesebacteria bacterium GW2011_GWA1_39_8]OGM05022.1 MAG: hypothetical protein A2124_03720 [Candidatus Woesebacteria bacterium GWB1_37_5]OGM24475.1 MAG: hypothetical protein A2715_00925 [Candidatus Woesebacteria bacterium RIFCSPHIGHO2_01_FULL_39_32]OGM63781.1 MAG: hypothetical protein A2893_02260 [Candidatus Woesebacteria bacterium RIFCSPLOWO2_01_FULL_39_25]
MSKLVLIDGNAILHRAYHALPPLTTKRGEPINAVYGLTSMLLRVIQDLKPTHIAVCFDRKEPTFRHKEFPKYQAQRPAMDKELSGQFEKAKDVLSAMNIPFFEMAGFEADDLLGSIADQGQSAKDKAQSIDEVVIVTGDRDILQLVDDKRKVRVYLPVRGLSDAKLMKSDDVVEKLGVKPVQIPDYKALVGDPSDNYPGVAGIGPKTAIDLLTRFGTLQGIYEHLNEINESALKKLEDGKESAYLSLKLAQIVTNVELDSDLEKTKRWQVDSPQLIALFSSYGFKTLTQRVKDVGKSVVDENQGNLFQ